jgi:ribosomal protein S18 acetylase RimI-like enzyme
MKLQQKWCRWVVCSVSLQLCAATQVSAFNYLSRHGSTTTTVTCVDPQRPDGGIESLAQLRYNEWIRDVHLDISPHAFLAATIESFEERVVQGGATVLLAQRAALLTAMLSEDRDSDTANREKGQNRALFRRRESMVVVGAAELSPLELEGCVRSNGLATDGHDFGRFLYVTDVVTCRTCRRQGVALALMKAMEELALQYPSQPCHTLDGATTPIRPIPMLTTLLLHVESTNQAALQMYQGEALRYHTVESISSHGNDNTGTGSDSAALASVLDVTRLAHNAGVSNQLLLYKTLSVPASHQQGQTKRRQRGGQGFAQ